MIPHLSFAWWLVCGLTILIAWLFEASFRLFKKRQGPLSNSSDQFLPLLKEKQKLESEVEKLEARPDLDSLPTDAPMGVRYMTRSELKQSQKIQRKKKEIELINERLKSNIGGGNG